MGSTKWWEELIDFSKNFNHFKEIDEEQKNNIVKKLQKLEPSAPNIDPDPDLYLYPYQYISAIFNRLCWNYVVGKDLSDEEKEQLKYNDNKKVKFPIYDELDGLLKDFCKNHTQYNGKLKKLKEIKVDRKEDINFSNEVFVPRCKGFVFPNKITCSGELQEVEFKYSIFLKGINCSGATFLQWADFEYATFSEFTNFSNAIFSKLVKFENTKFLQGAYFKDATFSQWADFQKAKFLEEASFSNTKFLEEASFSNTKFSKFVNFENTKISAKINFCDAVFLEEADFRKAKFSQEADFSGAKFSENAEPTIDFSGAKFSETTKPPTNFRGVKFSQDAYFRDATFSKTTDFREVEFSEKADFREVKFLEDAYFRGAAFSENADFREAEFYGHSYFNNSEFKRGTYFQKVIFSKRVPEFLDAELKEDTSFSGVHWPKKVRTYGYLSLIKKIFKRKGTQYKEEAKMQARAYECLALIMETLKRKGDAEFFFTKKMEIQTLLEKDIVYNAFDYFYEKTSNYGNSLQRPFWWFVGTGVWFGSFYYLMISLHSSCLFSKVNYGFEAFKVSLSNMLIFSSLLRLEGQAGYLERADCVIELIKSDAFFSSLGILQMFLGTTFLFLFFLTLRNKFRIFRTFK